MKRSELPENYEAICEAFDRSAGELTGEVLELLNSFDLADPERADPLAALVRDFEEQQESWKKEAARTGAYARVCGAAANTLKSYILERMDGLGVKELAGPRYVVREHQNTQPSIEWAGKGDIPKAFQRIKIELDSAKARVAYAAKKLPKGFLASVGRHLRIVG